MIWRVSTFALLHGVKPPLGFRYVCDDEFRVERIYALAPLHLLLRAWRRWQWPRWTIERWLLARGWMTLPPNVRPPTWPWGWRL